MIGRHAMTSHNKQHKNAKRKRRLNAPLAVSKADHERVMELLRK